MSQISDFENPWRRLLINTQASFRGVMFHVENGSRASGRRTALHEYPKRNDPYAEDMGRHARRFQISGYLVYRPRRDNETNPVRYDYVRQRIQLYEALEKDDAGRLVHPVFAPNGMDVMCERYSMTESRERGGYTQFDMNFVEVGSPTKSIGIATNTKTTIENTALAAVQSILTLRG